MEDAQAGLLRLALIVSPLAGLLAGATGWLVAREGLRPIAPDDRHAERHQRPGSVPPAGGAAHARRGGTARPTLNSLLDRIEEARRREREFTADASHELRTPSPSCARSSNWPAAAATDDRFVNALDSALEESDRLGQLIEDLLLLARTDEPADHRRGPRRRRRRHRPAPARIPHAGPEARDHGAQGGRGDAVVRADARALGARRREPARQRRPPRLGRRHRHAGDQSAPDGTAITVTDDGPGVPLEERDRMTQRFTQLDRTAVTTGGAGLGLAIVACVTAAHGGRLAIADADSGQGLAVTIHLPRPRRSRSPR